MDAIGTSELQRLIGQRPGPCVSVYLPTHAAGPQAQQDAVRLKNLLQDAENQLADGWMRPAEARDLLEAARALPSDPVFWSGRDDGLALFIEPGSFYCFREPVAFDALAVVGRRFHIKPVLPLLAHSSYFLLALSQNSVRLFRASRHAMQEVEVPGLPREMGLALNYAGADRGSQAHSAMRGALGKQAAVFHGHGGQADAHKDDLTQFFRQVDAALQPVLNDEQLPLMLAGVDYLLPLYRDVNRYAQVVRPQLVGNFDRLTAHQLRQRAWPLMSPMFSEARIRAADKYRASRGNGRALADVDEIVIAAYAGRIETLFVDVHAQQWGSYDPLTASVDRRDQPQHGDDDLLDLAAVQTLLHRGAVYSVDRRRVPGELPAAAVLRY